MVRLVEKANFGFESFANAGFYVAVNRQLVEIIESIREKPAEGGTIADIACGTGLMTELSFDTFKPRRVYLLDASQEALATAKQALMPYSETASFEYFKSDVQQAWPLPDDSADAILFTNAIHMLTDKEAAISEAARIIKRGGMIALNTTFFQGAYVEGSEKYWVKWVAEAMRSIRSSGSPFDRVREKAESMEWMGPANYTALLERHGFREASLQVVPTRLDREALEAIAEYEEFAIGALHVKTEGVDEKTAKSYIQSASTGLKDTVPKVLSDNNIEYIPRNWLQIVAVRE